LGALLQRAESDADIHALVLASANEKFFSIGLNIPQLYDLSQADFRHFYGAFNRLCIALFAFPKPTVAALTGHAVAGGCILALCCDYRFIAEGRKLMGLNEIKLGVPVPWPAHCILRNLVGDAAARDLMYSGEFIESAQALKARLVDQVHPLDEVRAQAIAFAAALGGLSGSAFRAIKHNRVHPVTTLIRESLEEKEAIFVEHWYSDFTREQLRAAIEKF
jgi:enoyl-CoA hydratase/carnithine racemase